MKNSFYNIFVLLFMVFTSQNFAQEESCRAKGETNQLNKRFNKQFEVNYPGDSSIDVTYYKLNLKVDHLFYTSNYISGSVEVKGKALSSNLVTLFLDLESALTVDSVKSSLGNIAYSQSNNKVNITLPSTLQINEEFDVIVYYKGVPGSSGWGSFEFTSHNGNPIIWTLSQPYGSSDWWPCKDTPADKPDSVDIWVTANSFFKTVSNGELIDVVDNGNGTSTYKWKVNYPIANYLISLAMTNYIEYVNDYVALDGTIMKVRHFTYPERWNDTRKAQLDATVDMIHEFALMYGEYPFLDEKYGHAEFGWGGGMEHQTISSMWGFTQNLVSHELAHQWFGDMITCKDWQSIWLNEGFATYSEALYIEKKEGFEAYRNYIAAELSYAKSAIGTLYCQDISSVNSIFNSARTYSKGASVLHMLRWVLGDSLFFKTIYEYANDPLVKYGVAVTEDFQRVAEAVSGRDLDFFFNEWIFGERHPKYNVNWFYTQAGNLYNVNLNITQSDNSNPLFFTMPIQLRFNTPTGDTLITVWNDQKSQDYNFTIIGKPSFFVLDPKGWLLKDIGTVVVGVEDPVNISNYKLEQNYPNPFNPGTKISYAIGYAENVRLTVYDVLGREIKTLVNEFQNPGEYSYDFNASGLAGGVYIYELKTKNYRESKKLVLLQ